MRLRVPLSVLAAAVALVGLGPTAGAQDVDGHHRGFGDPGGFLNVVPPGQDGVWNAEEAIAARGAGSYPQHVRDQLSMYADLVYEDATPGMTYGALTTYFKDASFGVPDDAIGRVYSPGGRDDVVVVRDTAFGVPHIFGDTREGAMFAAGYTGAEDRLFLMDVLRHLGRAELSAFLGASEGNRAMDRDQLAVAPYTEEDLVRQIEAIRDSGPVGSQVYADGSAYVQGVNEYIAEAIVDQRQLPAEYPALQQLPEEFVPADLVAIASLVGGIFGKGGGGEVANLCGLDSLADDLGGSPSVGPARRVFDDLKFPDDPEAPATAAGTFPYLSDLGPTDPAAVPALDCDSLEPIQAPPPDPTQFPGAVIDVVPVPPLPVASDSAAGATADGPFGPIVLHGDLGMSNALLVDAERSETGDPIAVFGPQTGYFIPQLLVEKDIHAPGIDARGVSFAGTDIYVQLGRGRDYAFSATSAGGDLVDERALELCEPGGGEPTVDSMGYRHHGTCVDIEAHSEVVIAKPSAGGVPVGEDDPPEQEDLVINKYFERAPHYGPITARGTTSDGTPVAITNQRSTYRAELESARGFLQVNDPGFMQEGYPAFRRAFGEGVDYTFNWFYVDAEHIGYQMSCKCPRRPQGVDPYLPTWGTGAWDWEGFIASDRLVHEVDPDRGYLISWNNKQADGWWSHDRQFGWGPIHRSSLLERRTLEHLEADGAISRPEAVDIMALAGTTDLRAQELVGLLREVMGDAAPDAGDPRAQEMFELLVAWAGDDHGHRRDHDADGAYEHAQAVAIMDAWWGGLSQHPDAKLFDAIFAEGTANARVALGIGVHDAPQRHLGSAFQDQVYAHVQKDLRQVLGRDVRGPFSRTYCGGGERAACSAALWDSLSAAAGALEAEFGSSSVSDWRRVPSDDEIRHTPVGVVEVAPIHWVNRPTFQQVVEVGAPLDAPDAVAASAPADGDEGPTPATGGGAVALAIALVAAALALTGRRTRSRTGHGA